MAAQISTTRLRTGIVVWLVSFLPFPILLLSLEHSHGNYTTSKESSQFLLIAFSIQYLIGFVGLFLAGSEGIKLVKHGGWRPMPGKLWRLIVHGTLPIDSEKLS